MNQTGNTLVALVTGAAQGLGLATCKALIAKGYYVIALSRKPSEDLLSLLPENHLLQVAQVDLSILDEVEEYIKNLETNIDVLINNAGVYLDKESYERTLSISELPISLLRSTLEVNVLAGLRLIQMVLPTMKQRNFGRIVNVSSGMGRFVELDRRAPYYRLSKVAMNAVTKIIADEVREFDIIINAVCPGWVRTNMGGPYAVRSIDEGIYGILHAACLPPSGPRGNLLRDGEYFGW
jgi:NAD(P)-dependent dehydrogenase (short-subunit alcohol dehydrogenase family)